MKCKSQEINLKRFLNELENGVHQIFICVRKFFEFLVTCEIAFRSSGPKELAFLSLTF